MNSNNTKSPLYDDISHYHGGINIKTKHQNRLEHPEHDFRCWVKNIEPRRDVVSFAKMQIHPSHQTFFYYWILWTLHFPVIGFRMIVHSFKHNHVFVTTVKLSFDYYGRSVLSVFKCLLFCPFHVTYLYCKYIFTVFVQFTMILDLRWIWLIKVL